MNVAELKFARKMLKKASYDKDPDQKNNYIDEAHEAIDRFIEQWGDA